MDRGETVFSRDSPVLDYWLSRCDGFTVRRGHRGIGEVERVATHDFLGRAEVLRIRSTLGQRLVPADQVAAVIPSRRLLILDREPSIVGRAHGAPGAGAAALRCSPRPPAAGSPRSRASAPSPSDGSPASSKSACVAWKARSSGSHGAARRLPSPPRSVGRIKQRDACVRPDAAEPGSTGAFVRPRPL